jgi:hypothetical protein
LNAGIVMKPPTVEKLIQQMLGLLNGFDPRTVVFLDRRGQWIKDPSTTRDRVSNELWFFIWKHHREDGRLEAVQEIFRPFVVDQISWRITERIYRWLCSSAPPKVKEVFQVTEILTALIQHQAWQRNAAAYLPNWDSKGKTRRAEYVQRAAAFTKGLEGCLQGETEVARFYQMRKQLITNQDRPIGHLSAVIAEEQSIQDQIEMVLQAVWEARQKDTALALLEEQIGPKLTMKPSCPQALLRPCLDLLTLPHLEMVSGLQYEVTGILGRLHDIRATRHLLAILENCPRRHTQVRSNAIFALGRIGEPSAVPYFLEILTGPDSIEVSIPDQNSSHPLSLSGEKRESIWALGRLGAEALEAIPVLTRYGLHPERDIKVLLAWSLGCIGKGQKETCGGLDAALVTCLLQLLQSEDGPVFEESAVAIRQLALPDFLHRLYLHNFSTVPILSLKPSSTGLYELSETLFYLMSMNTPVVMAVTGDSGTGKTYFCEALTEGFGWLRPKDILYLQRDRPGHMMMLNRILGFRWLRDHVDPQHYEDYPLAEEDDDPDLFFEQFMQQHSGRKLIILDGWRDPEYFHEVIRRFYDQGFLDILVKFHTTFSTKRLNLEEREGTLEGVTAHLPLKEDPAIEETVFYREGAVLLYQLDNSIPSRLDQSEIKEVFERKKISTWGDTVHIGKLSGQAQPISPRQMVWTSRREQIFLSNRIPELKETHSFVPRESAFLRILNEHPDEEPNLLEMIKLEDGTIGRIRFFTQGQIAYGGADGTVGILSGFQDRSFSASVHQESVRCLAVSGGAIFSSDGGVFLKEVSFGNKKINTWATGPSPVRSLACGWDGHVALGHEDGTVQLWDRRAHQMYVFRGHSAVVQTLALDRTGRVFSGDRSGEMRLWDLKHGRVSIFTDPASRIEALDGYPDGRWAIATRVSRSKNEAADQGQADVWIVDPENGRSENFELDVSAQIKAVKVYFDGRIFVGLGASPEMKGGRNLAIIDPRSKQPQIFFLSGHAMGTIDCITMGPRLITCGREKGGQGTVRIWGGESYIQSEIKRSQLLPARREKPPYCWTIF